MRAAGNRRVKGGSTPGLPDQTVIHGDCVRVMKQLPSASFDFVLTDPPYLCRYRSRTGESLLNDDSDAWVRPAFREIYRVLKPGTFCLSFYGWSHVRLFAEAWHAAGFRIVGHVVFRKRYASSSRFLRHQHEQAYLLAKGDAPLPVHAQNDVIEWVYTGNRLHPTQKPTAVLRPLIEAFCRPGGTVLDPFCGSGSTLVAAHECGRWSIGIELDRRHVFTARRRVATERK